MAEENNLCENPTHVTSYFNISHHGKPAYYNISIRDFHSRHPFKHLIMCGDCLHMWMINSNIIFAYKLEEEEIITKKILKILDEYVRDYKDKLGSKITHLDHCRCCYYTVHRIKEINVTCDNDTKFSHSYKDDDKTLKIGDWTINFWIRHSENNLVCGGICDAYYDIQALEAI